MLISNNQLVIADGSFEMSSKLLNYHSATTSAHSRFVNNSSAVTSNAVASSCSLNYDNLQLDEILCPVCASVLVEPVFLPCQHVFCRNCLRETIEKNKLNCPCCRKRFGTWYRNACRVNKLVHERLWQAIQSQFSDHLAEDTVLGSTKTSANGSTQHQKTCYMPPTNKNITLATPGEIRKEFTNEIKRYQKERLEEATKELAATEQCILNLYKQEGIIDLGDNSSHVSVSSTTSPDLHDSAEKITIVSNTPMAGPSSLCNMRSQLPEKVQSLNQMSKDGVQKSMPTIGSMNVKSPSNGSVISISSTSSAQSGVTASSCASSSASERYSLLKSVVQQVGRSAELVKQKVQGTILNRLTAGKLQQHQKTLRTFDLNNSEHCVKPTALHKVEQRGIREEDSIDDGTMNDTDSLKSEQNHFIPIIVSLPKSSFSLDTVTNSIPVRPIVSPLKYNYTPKKSPYRPLKGAAWNLSAFSVVNLFTPPKMSPIETEGTSARSKRNDKTPISTPRRGRPRRVKLNFTANRARKTASRSLDLVSTAASSSTSTRRTRRTVDVQPSAIRELIISDQQRREKQIEMERRDFEFAQRLQEKLNRTCGIMQEIHRQYPTPRSSGYSLRRKGTLNQTIDSSCIKNVNPLNPVAHSSPEEGGHSKKSTPAKKSRKRKATSSSVENDVPSNSSPAKQAADQLIPRQTRQSRTSKLNNASLLSSAPSATVEQQSIPQRKSTRNKTH